MNEIPDTLRILLRREESYAVHALIYICENPSTNAGEVAERLKLPPAFMAKVLRRLVTAGLICSHMGRNGGVELALDLANITLLDVIERVSGPVILDTCQVKEQCASQERKGHCQLKAAWIATTLEIRAALDKVRLSQLCDTVLTGPVMAAGRPKAAAS